MIVTFRLLPTLAGVAVVAAVASACSTAGQESAGTSTPAPSAGTSQQVTETNPPGDIPDNQAFVVYTAADGSYSIKYPEGWARTESGADINFTDKYNSLTLSPHNGFYQPTESYARTVELPQIASSTAGFSAGKVGTVQRPAGSVVLITYQADSAPNAVTGKSVRQDVARYEYSRDGRGVVVTLAAPVGSDNVDAWRTITDSFTWLR
jgi:hypothetical protein